ncbi:upstream-binding factor 1-like protein 1 [Erinaceus europaeus]|uniref:Upstream-binding factor 1-like protein 1 n=1 Tax=Erinaceus europaeus TaxID=9365 RepID=A0ABM3WT03_ERIEU|nr:upstream-binding factor 1-like protein 1 [Erinaceus europaeus]
MRELVLDAKECTEKFYKMEKRKRHPDLPKKPLTAYLRFFKEQRLQYSQMYPKLSNQELTKLLSEKYKELPEQMKLKYIQGFQEEKKEYEEKMDDFRENNTYLFQKSKKAHTVKRRTTKAQEKFLRNSQEVNSFPEHSSSQKLRFLGEPQKPPMNAYHKFHMDMWSSRELKGMHSSARMVEVSRCWHRVPQSQREQYQAEAEELQRQYWVDLDVWLRSLTPEEYATYKESSRGKRKPRGMMGGPPPKTPPPDLQPPAARTPQEGLGEKKAPEEWGLICP